VFHQAVANELGLNFISVKGPELLSMVGCLVPLSYASYNSGALNDI